MDQVQEQYTSRDCQIGTGGSHVQEMETLNDKRVWYS